MGKQKQTIMEPTERTTNLNEICRFILFFFLGWQCGNHVDDVLKLKSWTQSYVTTSFHCTEQCQHRATKNAFHILANLRR